MDYTGNSNKNKDQSKKTEVKKEEIVKVVSGDVIEKPKGLGHKFKNIFFGGDFKNAMRTVTGDVILPAIRTLIVESITKGTERIVFGETQPRRQYTNYGSRIQYSNPLRQPDPRMARLPDQRPRPLRADRLDVGDYILATKEDAENAVERIVDIIDKYEFATLGDFKGILGLEGSPIDEKWGWTYFNNVVVRQTRDGYLIELPPVQEL